MPDRSITIRGNTIANTNQRAFIDCGRAGGTSVTIRNLGPDTLEHSANADGSTPTTIAAQATGSLSGRRYLRSLGKSKVWVETAGGGIEGVVI